MICVLGAPLFRARLTLRFRVDNAPLGSSISSITQQFIRRIKSIEPIIPNTVPSIYCFSFPSNILIYKYENSYLA